MNTIFIKLAFFYKVLFGGDWCRRICSLSIQPNRDATFHGASNSLLFSHLVLLPSLFTFFTLAGVLCHNWVKTISDGSVLQFISTRLSFAFSNLYHTFTFFRKLPIYLKLLQKQFHLIVSLGVFFRRNMTTKYLVSQNVPNNYTFTFARISTSFSLQVSRTFELFNLFYFIPFHLEALPICENYAFLLRQKKHIKDRNYD